MIPCYITFHKANTIVGCTESVLVCHWCRLDSKFFILVTAALQKVLTWFCVEHEQYGNAKHEPPAEHFDSWKTPEADGRLVQELLTSRVLDRLPSTANLLRIHMDEINCIRNQRNQAHVSTHGRRFTAPRVDSPDGFSGRVS